MQHEAFQNPARGSRARFPLVVVLQSNYAAGGRRIVAPMVPSDALRSAPASKAIVLVTLNRKGYGVMLPLLASMEAARLRGGLGSVAAFRDDITRGLDWLFFGI